jgi:hypothetical protein
VSDHEPPRDPEDNPAEDPEEEDELAEEKCSFCGRTAFDVERMVVQGGARICNFCIKEFHARLNPKPKPDSKPKPTRKK